MLGLWCVCSPSLAFICLNPLLSNIRRVLLYGMKIEIVANGCKNRTYAMPPSNSHAIHYESMAVLFANFTKVPKTENWKHS